jgi:hypothetical protein
LLRRKLNTLERVGLTKPDELGVNQAIDRDDAAQTTLPGLWSGRHAPAPAVGATDAEAGAPVSPPRTDDDWLTSLAFGSDEEENAAPGHDDDGHDEEDAAAHHVNDGKRTRPGVDDSGPAHSRRRQFL